MISQYLTACIFAAIVSAILTWAVWRAGNKQQDAVIAETNERTTTLERDASDAKASQQRVEKELAEARTAQAAAEKSLLELQERVKDRHFTEEERTRVVSEMRSVAGRKITIASTPGSPEAKNFASEIIAALEEAGVIVEIKPITGVFGSPTGVIFEINDDKSLELAELLQNAFGSKFNTRIASRPGGSEPGVVHIFVALKP